MKNVLEMAVLNQPKSFKAVEDKLEMLILENEDLFVRNCWGLLTMIFALGLNTWSIWLCSRDGTKVNLAAFFKGEFGHNMAAEINHF